MLSQIVADLSGVPVVKSWFSKWFGGSKPVPVVFPPVKSEKSDLIVVTVSLPPVVSCSHYDVKVAVSLPEFLKPVAAPVPVPAAPVPVPALNNPEIYDSILAPVPSAQSNPVPETPEVVSELPQDTPPA